ncbi:uncharacterized protein LOC131653443 isoform X2 [Vicia villosa]|nr:uncharacterized protein LOC131653443 isoform X2 [Vicia villosa]
MAQEQEDQSRNNCINGGRSTKRPKQKKVPQRGLGVAQLEKILEEQHMKDGVVISPSKNSSTSSSSPTTISSYLPLPINNFNHSNVKDGAFILPSQNSTSSTSSSLSSTSSTTISNYLPLPITNYNLMNQNSSPSPLPMPQLDFRSPMSLQHLDGKASGTVPLNNSGVFGNVPKFWSSRELDYEKESFGMEHGLPFVSSLPFDSNPIWPLPNWVQRSQFHHQPSSQVVNNSSGTSSTHLPQLSIEPPSNQNSTSNGPPIRSAEKMMIGMKRPYPFSLDFPQTPLNYKLPSIGQSSTNGRTSCESENGYHLDAAISNSRESQSCSASNSDPKSKKKDKGIKEFDGSFLTLAPPTPPTLYAVSPSKPLESNSQESPEKNIEDQFSIPAGYRLVKQQNFIPGQNGQTTSRNQNGHEVEEIIDLNLKL